MRSTCVRTSSLSRESGSKGSHIYPFYTSPTTTIDRNSILLILTSVRLVLFSIAHSCIQQTLHKQFNNICTATSRKYSLRNLKAKWNRNGRCRSHVLCGFSEQFSIRLRITHAMHLQFDYRKGFSDYTIHTANMQVAKRGGLNHKMNTK